MRLKIILTSFFSLIFLSSALVFQGAANAQDPTQLEEACTGSAASSPICVEARKDKSNETTGLDTTLRTITNLIAWVAGIISVIIIVLSGISMVTSSGDSAKVSKNRDTIIYATVGIIAIIFARTVVLFIIEAI